MSSDDTRSNETISLGDKLMSRSAMTRSQAKAVLSSIPTPCHVTLDFDGITFANRSFLDEAFRVWANDHPGSTVAYANAAPDIEATIRPIVAGRDSPVGDG